ncbi:hypothetical protein [Mycobacterium sp. 1245801.1]|uniref:DUF7246 family protein n=1 Tax=Mycobacterium sp. 1245801.1 TaxID=1834075 RepID=UPI0007FEC684|nr:hypothetical protein [Mycobacterium sp. 1245801.1]OBJ24472.1 hypothetical protein A5622_11840 [Mycobacterium sp. 1245801.1]
MSPRVEHVTIASTVVGEPAACVNGELLEPGTEVSIRGKRGRFKYLRASETSEGRVVLDFIGGTIGHETWHSFYPERIANVHKSTTMRTWRNRRKP